MNIAIVSLSRGTIGEGFVVHEVEIGVRRLKEYGTKGKKSNDFLPLCNFAWDALLFLLIVR